MLKAVIESSKTDQAAPAGLLDRARQLVGRVTWERSRRRAACHPAIEAAAAAYASAERA
jgi:hypothetical protein